MTNAEKMVVPQMYTDDFSQFRKLGHFMCVFDIARYTDPAKYQENIMKMIDDLHEMTPEPGFNVFCFRANLNTSKSSNVARTGFLFRKKHINI